MILIAGVPSEPPVRLAVEAARQLGVEYRLLDERLAGSWDTRLAVTPSGVAGRIVSEGTATDLDVVGGAYLRLNGAVPPRGGGGDPAEPERRLAVVAWLSHWSETAPARVANRPEAMASNSSKPYQARLIQKAGFATPPTLVTNDPSAVRAFQAQHGRLVYKSTSGARSVVRELTPKHHADLHLVRHLPTQFQRLLDGRNVRVHVIAEAVLACAVDAETLDYRYPEDGTRVRMTPIQLPEPIEERCRTVSKCLGLPLCGIDLLCDDGGEWWCFEVNPSPGYSHFEEATGLPISRCLVRWLATGEAGSEHAPAGSG